MRYSIFCFSCACILLFAPALRAQRACDTTARPVVMVHGFLASGDTWSRFCQSFESNGYCPNRLGVYDWNTLNQLADQATGLDKFIDVLLQQTGATQVDLIGHSAGGGVAYSFLAKPERAAKVAHYVHIGSMPQSAPADPEGRVPMLNLWSDGDQIAGGKAIPGAANVQLPGLDHYQVATSIESFRAVFRFLTGTDAVAAPARGESPVSIGGKVLSFGENKPVGDATVEIFTLDAQTGVRAGETWATMKTDENGRWHAPSVSYGVPLELVVRPPEGGRTVHYFHEGLTRTNRWVYLRTLPAPGSMAGLLLAGLPNDSAQAVVNVFSSSQAVIAGRDSLSVDGNLISTTQHAGLEKTAISFFLYDGNKNRQSDGNAVGMFARFPFLSGVDMFIDPLSAAPLNIRYNGRRMCLPKIPSSKGIAVVVFD